MNLSPSEKANLSQIGGFVEHEVNAIEVAEWFRNGFEKGEPLPSNINAVEQGIQFLRSYLTTDGPYKESAPTLVEKLTKLITDQEADDMLTASPREATLPTPNIPASTGLPFEFVGLSNGDTIQSFDQLVSWQSTDGSTTRQWDLLIREAQYGPFSTTSFDTDNVLYDSQGLGTLSDTSTQPIPWPNDGGALYVRLSASGPNGWSGWDAIAEGFFIDITLNSWTEPPAPVVPFGFVGIADGDTITNANELLYWSRTDGNTLVQWDLLLREDRFGPFSTTQLDTANTFYDSQGIGTETDTSTQPITWPTGGQKVYARLSHSNPVTGEWAGWDAIAEGTYLDIELYAPTSLGVIDKTGMQLWQVPENDISEADYGLDDWEAMVGPNRDFWEAFDFNGVTSVTEQAGRRAIKCRLSPFPANVALPSTRSLGGFRVLGSPSAYRVSAQVYVESPFSWGGTQKTGKIGMGIAGKDPAASSNTPPSGGQPVQDGFSERVIWDDDGELKGYHYDANTVNFGDRTDLNFTAPLNQWFELAMEVTISSAAGVADGRTRVFVNGDLKMDRQNIEFFGTGTPVISRVWLSASMGGNNDDYEPTKPDNCIYFSNMYHGPGAFADAVAPVTGTTMTYAEIRAAAPNTHGYPSTPSAYWHAAHLGAFLRLNPNAGDWDADEASEVITVVELPTPVNPIMLPSPSGGNDANAINSVISANPGRDLVGTGTYRFTSTVNMSRSVRIFNMPSELAGSLTTGIDVSATKAGLYYSPMDCKNVSSVNIGIRVRDGAHDFRSSESGVRNIYHRHNIAGAAILIGAAENFRVTRGTWQNIIADVPDTSASGGSMRAWRVASSSPLKSPKGYFANNTVQNIQANNNFRDGELFVCQGFTGSTDNVYLLGNDCVDAGKRFIKCQHPNVFASSNFYHWKTKVGPLGNRTMLHLVNCQLDADDVMAINNHFKIDGEGRYSYPFRVEPEYNNRTYRNIHCDFNIFDIDAAPAANFYSHFVFFSNKDGDSADNRNALVNCSFKDNIIRGAAINHIFSFGPGYTDNASNLDIDISGNDVQSNVLISDFRGSSTNYNP